MNGLNDNPIGFSTGNGISAVTYASYAEDNGCTYVQAQNNSDWFTDYLYMAVV